VRSGEDMTAAQVSRMADVINVASEKDGSAMPRLFVLSALYLGLEKLKAERPDGILLPEPEIPTRKRPVINFARKIFNKQ
jgi:hypothetical protein